MTRSQFSRVVNAGEKWVENSVRLLGRHLTYTPGEAKWLGLVRVLNNDLGIPLARSAVLAAEALKHPVGSRAVPVGRDDGSAAGIVIDLARYHSGYAAAISAALNLGGGRKRGRRSSVLKGSRGAKHGSAVRERTVNSTAWDALSRAAAHGIDLGGLREGLRMSPGERLQRLEENAAFISELRRSVDRRSAPRRGKKGVIK